MKEETYYEVHRVSTLDKGNRTRWVMRKSDIPTLEDAKKVVRDEVAIGHFKQGDFKIFRMCRHLEPFGEEENDAPF